MLGALMKLQPRSNITMDKKKSMVKSWSHTDNMTQKFSVNLITRMQWLPFLQNRRAANIKENYHNETGIIFSTDVSVPYKISKQTFKENNSWSSSISSDHKDITGKLNVYLFRRFLPIVLSDEVRGSSSQSDCGSSYFDSSCIVQRRHVIIVRHVRAK